MQMPPDQCWDLPWFALSPSSFEKANPHDTHKLMKTRIWPLSSERGHKCVFSLPFPCISVRHRLVSRPWHLTQAWSSSKEKQLYMLCFPSLAPRQAHRCAPALYHHAWGCFVPMAKAIRHTPRNHKGYLG